MLLPEVGYRGCWGFLHAVSSVQKCLYYFGSKGGFQSTTKQLGCIQSIFARKILSALFSAPSLTYLQVRT